MKSMMSSQVFPMTKSIRDRYRNLPSKDPKPFMRLYRDSGGDGAGQSDAGACLRRDDRPASGFSVARTRPFFDVMEKATPGNGGLYSATIDPGSAAGCLSASTHAVPARWRKWRNRTAKGAGSLKQAFTFLSTLPNTAPCAFSVTRRHRAAKPNG